MTQATFVDRRRAAWRRMEALLGLLERHGLRSLTADEVSELGLLYRWVTSDLAFAEGRGFDVTLLAYLNRLTARAHAYVYGQTPGGGFARVVHFYRSDLPNEIRRSRSYVLACAVVFYLAALLAYWLVASKPVNAYAIFPAETLAPIHKSLHDSNFAVDRAFAPAMSTFIITNNIEVAVLSFAGGVTLGVVTLWALIYNGLNMGGYGALFANAGFGYDFWATIAPHGVIELTAIQIAAAAGLLLAAAVVNPGRLRRGDALKRNARRAGVLILGVASMLVVAGAIEGFFSPLRLPPEARLAMGAFTGLLMASYFGFAGRRESALGS